MKMTVAGIRTQYLRLAEVVAEKKLFKSTVNFAIAKNYGRLEKEVKSADEAMKSYVESFVKKDGSGNPEIKDKQYIFETAEDKASYVAAMQELEKVEVDIEIVTVKQELLETEDEKLDKPTAADLIAMEFMIEA